MCVLELKEIGKIYATEDAIAVGIRGVNLSFDLGEFVAITGQSGSGKTSLLNVIGGMDSYEEGELLIEGEPTSHYIDEEWEEYRKRYISYVFQEQTILDSVTVLQNVELALLHIENRAERRAKAMELISRVGLEGQARRKGGQLSGGQKQKTVIARALAKDSPIILADEPTGNLDAEASAEIMRLLKEVSKNKLVLVVTHSFDEVAPYATREIKVYDGSIETDTVLQEAEVETGTNEPVPDKQMREKDGQGIVRKGLYLGGVLLRAKPALSAFMCALIVLAGCSLFLITAIVGKELKSFFWSSVYLFQEEEGRVIVTKKDGSAISAEEAGMLAETYGAAEYLHCDILCDHRSYNAWHEFTKDPGLYSAEGVTAPFLYGISDDVGEPDVGRHPETESECLLYVPYCMADYYGKNELYVSTIVSQGISYDVVGVKYFVDNNQRGKLLFTEKGYAINSVMAYIGQYTVGDVACSNAESDTVKRLPIAYSFDVEEGKAYVKLVTDVLGSATTQSISSVQVKLMKGEKEESYKGESIDGELLFTVSQDAIGYDASTSEEESLVVMNPNTALEHFEAYTKANYSQCSLYFNTEKSRESAMKKLNQAGYLAVESDARYVAQDVAISEYLVGGALMVLAFLAAICFLVLLISLCTKNVATMLRTDVGILRSFGMESTVIRIALCVCTICWMLPAVIIVPVGAYCSYYSVLGNKLLMYLYPGHYVLIFAGLIFVTVFAMRKQVNRIFSLSVKNVLRRG